ncbi:MAG: hypothetical protein N3B10_02415 [Armatimonadetes bacterium]|nr:hypothetical protein [Armatimonadota bacterium]
MSSRHQLNEKELASQIKNWFEALVKEAPESDPRRTSQCLSIPEAVDYARNKAAGDDHKLNQHIAKCTFCQSAIAIARKVFNEQCLQAQISDEMKAFPEVLRQRLREWVAEQPTEQDCPAHFNEQGVLQVHWKGLPKEGSVKVSLLWGETLLPLGSGVVRNGILTFSRPLPHLGLRSIGIPRSLLHLEWESDVDSQQPSSSMLKQDAKTNHPKEGDK